MALPRNRNRGKSRGKPDLPNVFDKGFKYVGRVVENNNPVRIGIDNVMSDPLIGSFKESSAFIDKIFYSLSGLIPEDEDKDARRDKDDTQTEDQKLSYGIIDRLDTFNHLLSRLNPFPEAKDTIFSVEADTSRNMIRKKSPDLGLGWLGLIPLVLSGFLENMIQPMIKAMSNIAKWFINLFKKIGNFLGKILSKVSKMVKWILDVIPKTFKDLGKKFTSMSIKAVEKIGELAIKYIIEPAKALVKKVVPQGVQAATAAVARTAQNIASRFTGQALSIPQSSIITKMGGLGKLLKFASRLPLLSGPIVLLVENIERNEDLKGLNKQLSEGKISEEEFKQKSTEGVVQMWMDTIASLAGASLGGVVGSIGGPLGTFAGGVAGSIGGLHLSKVLGEKITPIIARAINSESGFTLQDAIDISAAIAAPSPPKEQSLSSQVPTEQPSPPMPPERVMDPSTSFNFSPPPTQAANIQLESEKLTEVPPAWNEGAMSQQTQTALVIVNKSTHVATNILSVPPSPSYRQIPPNVGSAYG